MSAGCFIKCEAVARCQTNETMNTSIGKENFKL